MLLAFDCETSGLFDRNRPDTDPEQPRLAQLGAVLADSDGNEKALLKLLVKPDSWEMTAGAQAIHGITTAMASRFGVPSEAALYPFVRLLDQATHLISHGLEFDMKMIKREVFALGQDPAALKRTRLTRICTMKLGAQVNDGAWPKLPALHQILFGIPFVSTHDGLEDSRAALRCYLELRARGLTGEADD